ncbi:MAG: cysteine desulfurase [Alicyclobacillaceae bacterium]|nr:cysteine desulfurase [Alicyclobacillaceae bacterium]
MVVFEEKGKAPGAGAPGRDLTEGGHGSGEELYFDTAATTPLLPEVRQALTGAFEVFGNPSSLHRKGIEAEEAVERARAQVQQLLGVRGGRLVFTGSGTEANNLAILGVARRFAGRGRHLVTTMVEHPSVLEPFRRLERDGWQVTFVPPDRDGAVPAGRILEAVRDDTVLVSVMHVNNETGAILPVLHVGEALRARPRTLFHVDGVQAFGKLGSPLRDLRADMYTLSGHKIGAPKGIAALWVRDGLELEPIVYGGGQQYGLRSGTENVPGIVALGAAAAAAQRAFPDSLAHVQALADRLCLGLSGIPGCVVNRPPEASPYIVNVSFPGLRGEVLVHAFEAAGLYVSTGSACSSRRGKVEASHVLRAMGRSQAEITGAIRFSLGRWHTAEMVDRAVAVVAEQTAWVRRMMG